MNGDVHHGLMQDTLRTLRAVLGVSQEGFARALGVTSVTVSRWERHGRIPDERLYALARQAVCCQRLDLAHLFMDIALYRWINACPKDDRRRGLFLHFVDMLHTPEHDKRARRLIEYFGTGEWM